MGASTAHPRAGSITRRPPSFSSRPEPACPSASSGSSSNPGVRPASQGLQCGQCPPCQPNGCRAAQGAASKRGQARDDPWQGSKDRGGRLHRCESSAHAHEAAAAARRQLAVPSRRVRRAHVCLLAHSRLRRPSRNRGSCPTSTSASHWARASSGTSTWRARSAASSSWHSR